MKLYLDSANPNDWTLPAGVPTIAGVTTNPTLVRRAGREVTLSTYLDLIRQAGKGRIRELMLQMPRPDSGEISAWLAELMPAAARERVQLTIKLPCHPDWAHALETVQDHGLPTLLTGLSNPMQLMWAVERGASWVAPYIGRLEDANRDVLSLLHACVRAQNEGPGLLAASVKSPDVLARLMGMGAAAVTIAPALVREWITDPVTDAAIAQFNADVG